MPAVTMLDRLIEAAFKELLSVTVTGPTYHLSYDKTENMPPSIVIKATLGTEEPVQGSGVFSVPVEIVVDDSYDDTQPWMPTLKNALKCYRLSMILARWPHD